MTLNETRRDELPICGVCDGVIFDADPADLGDPDLQHVKCNASVSDAYQAGLHQGLRSVSA